MGEVYQMGMRVTTARGTGTDTAKIPRKKCNRKRVSIIKTGCMNSMRLASNLGYARWKAQQTAI
jgi:hypothetical protein